ncbi:MULTISPECIES: 4-(cytidine 5'-diphospho)-2-C-methyl-D-erythritol kinase [unclassified Curtobacterium]|jgi:4-diphosphocytidyl-2-C-methyl-D-erythritol kinase|uniref:4-(cytidine 5'-diphospho)-2-C-methyl-D-erythritol kinase n=1 Tax=unclassified Curtobacterium TaxID=257496 RepID=UPI00089DE88B|nr:MULTISPECIES: 4-(cytidine 5'-diphospho)-2-C-methyl-D-erythritol kinase [unclassified Curtobacterium]AOX66399.1 4-(cytidine 5'-diphospho)-2-C-methyl-D-erythritol kinase [Curtobacterium sp. BH-2-1-1]MCT9620766.1 4-(cytidine 5'-diphospho)-2-C-methyl-D-erythritol kinase [Curtobacterium sp. C2H10]MDR6172731.1 4-diphosphocytidyl-2-C-methyl-D-erythritol kinase [Curtobacterium sp. SORGH_AS_0776]SFF60984.1 4-diphosphocytidyl-2-C-methyl-D-erythritol kinase [Curtobacterium sp. YR515]
MTTLAAPTRVRTRAPGKINVYLSVGALQDDGYHDVATAYQAVSLYEDVSAEPADDFSVTFTGPIDTRSVPVDESNLAIRAARLVADAAGYRGGVRLTIDKQVPVAGGMGGGSADAAATLLAVDTLWGTALGREELLRLAAQLGADVPFAFAGGTAVGTGRGDELSPALAKGEFHWVLALSDAGLSTPAVYRALDEHRERYRADIAPAPTTPVVEANVLQALRAGDPDLLADCLHNDLQAPAMRLQPALATTLEIGEKAGALAGLVSGSGPTVAFLVADRDAALEVQVELSAAGMVAVRAAGPVHGARVLH